MFKGNVTIRKENETHYMLVGFLSYKNHEIEVIAKGGFLTDAASIPRFLWRVIGSPFTGKYTSSAILHDLLFATHIIPKVDADKLFLEMLEVEGVIWWKRTLMYYGVKWFGASSWNKDEKTIEENKKYVEVITVNSIS